MEVKPAFYNRKSITYCGLKAVAEILLLVIDAVPIFREGY